MQRYAAPPAAALLLLAAGLAMAADHDEAPTPQLPAVMTLPEPAAAPRSPTSGGEAAAQGLSCQQAWDRLMAGNKRFTGDITSWVHRGGLRRQELVEGQHPVAVVVCCSDSRVPPELLFDQGMGDLFVVRTAGNVVDALALGSIEYACEHLHVPLVLVLGHERCGAVTAAIGREPPPGHILSVVERIQGNLALVPPLAGDAVEAAMQSNARAVARTIAHAKPILEPLVRDGTLLVVTARYDLRSGAVTTLP